jgi:AraC-like DNA-binding protein
MQPRATPAPAFPALDASPISIEFHPPSEALAPLVETFYLYRCEVADVEGVQRLGVGQIRFMLAGEALFQYGRTTAMSLPVSVTPPPTSAARYRALSPIRCFGVTLTALGWRAITGLHARMVAERVMDGAALFGPDALRLHRRLRTLGALEEMIALTELFLWRQVRPISETHLALLEAVERWSKSDALGVDALYAATPLSPRQVTRLLNEFYGGPPKHIERRIRATRAAVEIARGADPRQVAERFYDQPHMIRELKQFVGHTPRSLRERGDPLLLMTLANHGWDRLLDAPAPRSAPG